MTRLEWLLLLPQLAQEIRDWQRHGYPAQALRTMQEYDTIAATWGFPTYREENDHDR